MSKKIEKRNLAFLTAIIRKKETMGSKYSVSYMPFDISEIPSNDKWEYLKNQAVLYLIETKKIPSFSLDQDYEYTVISYKSFEEIERQAYKINESDEEEKVITVFNNAFDKIVLPNGYREKIIEVVGQLKDSKKIFEEWGLGDKIKKGKGVNLLFMGKPGTGKTYCGEIIAEYLGTEFNVISVASVESKWVGESEKNISNIFKSLSGNNQVLILDEVDSWLSSRSNSNQAYYQKLTNQFLIELERHDGICIMTTNRPITLDKALNRRIDLILDFPNPDKEARKKIWEYMIPDKMPTKDIDLNKLSSFDINGGSIKNSILSAARKAIIRDSKVTNDIIVESIIEEQKESELLSNSKDHS